MTSARALEPTHGPGSAARQEPLFTATYLTLWLCNFFLILGMSVYVLLPHYLMLRGTSEGFYGAVSGTIGLASFACGIALGHLGDRWNRKTALNLYLAPGVAGTVLALLALESDPAWYFVVRMLHGVATGLGFPIFVAWVLEASPTGRRTEALAYFGLSGLIAGSFGPFLGELLLSWQGAAAGAMGYRWVFALSLASTLVALALVQLRRAPAQDASGERARGGLLTLMSRPAPRLVLAMVVNFGGVSFILMFFGKTFAAHLHLAYSTVLFAAFTAGAVSSRIGIRWILARVTQSHLIVAALLGIVLSMTVAAFAQGYVGLALAGWLYGTSHGVLYPSLYLRFLEFHAPQVLGRASTLYSGAFSLGSGLYPYLGGFLLQATNFPTLFLAAGGLALISLGLHVRVERAMRSGR